MPDLGSKPVQVQLIWSRRRLGAEQGWAEPGPAWAFWGQQAGLISLIQGSCGFTVLAALAAVSACFLGSGPAAATGNWRVASSSTALPGFSWLPAFLYSLLCSFLAFFCLRPFSFLGFLPLPFRLRPFSSVILSAGCLWFQPAAHGWQSPSTVLWRQLR